MPTRTSSGSCSFRGEAGGVRARRRSLKAWFPPLLLGVTVAGGLVEGRVRDQLCLGLEANVRAVEMWMEAQEATVRLVAENPRVLALAAELMAASRKPGMTDDALRARPEQEEFRRLVVSLDRKTRSPRPGTDLSRRELVADSSPRCTPGTCS